MPKSHEPPRQDLLSTLAPAFLVRAVEALRDCRSEGLKVCAFETLRTSDRQRWLFAQGRDRPGDRITNARTVFFSNHGYGLALDVAFLRSLTKPDSFYWPPPGDPLWFKMMEIMESKGLACGGRWSGSDWPHVQPRYVPVTPSPEMQKMLKGGAPLHEIWHSLDQITVHYFDKVGWE